jgi:Bacterial PH domain
VECPAVSSQQDPAGDREVFRGAGSLILWWLWVVFAAVAVIDLIVQGSGRSAVIMAVLVAAITGLVYGCALRPRIVADGGGITVENPLRDHRVPWGAVEKVDAAHAVRVHCAPAPGASKGQIISSWAVQSSPRAARAAEYRSRRQTRRMGQPAGYGRYPAEAQEALRRSPAEATARQLDERAKRERAAGAAGGQPEARWAWAAIAVMAVPLVALVVVVLA